MMTGEILYAVVNQDDERQSGYKNTFSLYNTKSGAKGEFNRCVRRNPDEVFRIIKVHLEEVDTIETSESS